VSFTVTGITAGHVLPCQRPRQDGNGSVSERPVMVDAVNGSTFAASKPGAIFSGEPN
jgi:hypothetical protein